MQCAKILLIPDVAKMDGSSGQRQMTGFGNNYTEQDLQSCIVFSLCLKLCLNVLPVHYLLLQVAMRCGVPASSVRNVIIWGNHSSTQYPDVHHCIVNMSGSELACFEAVKDDTWLKGEFITVSQMSKKMH